MMGCPNIYRATTLRLSAWGELTLEERSLPLTVKVSAPHEAATLDGGSVRTTDRKPSQAPKEMVHDRYKALASVARALRACKTIPLAVRPLCLRLRKNAAPALVVMRASQSMRYLAACWSACDGTVAEGRQTLTTLGLVAGAPPNAPSSHGLPTPRASIAP